ncbi:hypothetical protein Cpir12675_001263 [Ceratocystis pirilliformis]|uniref:C3H1-type domain-containing protein n=1 Tax=Ceratocystis pirilliformis TaxID=259994 RepID=A0ABR3ZIN4_9PEZI
MSNSPPGLTFMGSPAGTITPDSLLNEASSSSHIPDNISNHTTFDMESMSLNDNGAGSHNHDHQIPVYLSSQMSQKQPFASYSHLGALTESLATPRHVSATTRVMVPSIPATTTISMEESLLPTLAPLPAFGSSGFPRVSTSGQGPLGSYGHIGIRGQSLSARNATFVSNGVAQNSLSNQATKNDFCQQASSQSLVVNLPVHRSVNMQTHIQQQQQQNLNQSFTNQQQLQPRSQSQFSLATQPQGLQQSVSDSPPSASSSSTDAWQMADYSLAPPFVPSTSAEVAASGYATSGPYTSGAQMTGALAPLHLHQLQQQLHLQQRQPQIHNPTRAFSSQQQLSVALTQSDIDTNYGYCLDRGNGKFTRLVPADMLPAMKDIPAIQDSCSGLVVLPTPRSQPPVGAPAMNQPVTMTHIDNIVKSTPAAHKKPKIFCDKWVHEGVCAFTQQGCKFKHEMPTDKETQHSLGLFHGLPLWWKRQQSNLQQLRQATSPGDAQDAASSSSGSPNGSIALSRSAQSPGSQTQAHTRSQGQGQSQISPAYTKALWRSEASGNTNAPTSANHRTGSSAVLAEKARTSAPTASNSDAASLFSSSDRHSLRAPPGLALQNIGQSQSPQGQPQTSSTAGQDRARGQTQSRSSFYQSQSHEAATNTGGSCVWGPIAPPAKPQNDS